MDRELKKLFQISSFFLKSISTGLDAVARSIDALIQSTGERASTSASRDESGPAEGAQPDAAPARTETETDTAAAVASGGSPTKTDIILSVIAASEEGADVETIFQRTGYDKNTIRSAASRLRKQGKVKSKKQGVYMAV